MREKCPWCDSDKIDQEMVDVGPGSVPMEPAHCVDCGAHEIDWRHFMNDPYYAEYKYDPPPTVEEVKKGWMKGRTG